MLDLFSLQVASAVRARTTAEVNADRPVTEGRVRDALLAYHQGPEVVQSINRHSKAVSAINGVRAPTVRTDLLIQEADASLDDYPRRVVRSMGSDEWSVAYFGLYAATAAMWDAAQSCSDSLVHTLGYRPEGRVDID